MPYTTENVDFFYIRTKGTFLLIFATTKANGKEMMGSLVLWFTFIISYRT